MMPPFLRFLLTPLVLLACARAEPLDRASSDRFEDVAAVRVGASQAPGVYRAAGTVRAARRADLATRLMGRIESVRVRAGDAVRRGDLLLTVEHASLTAGERQAAAALELATTNLRRVERLYADSAAPLVQLEAARDGFARAEAQVRQVQADLGYAELRAPFSGTVTARLVDPGDQAAPGQPLLVLEDRAAREIVVTVPDELRGELRPGQVVTVEIGAGGRRTSARVLAVVPGADPQSPAVEVRLEGAEGLAPGLAAVAEFPRGVRSELLVPRSALVARGQLEGVFIFAPDSTLRLRWVRTGRVQDDAVEVLSGLQPGDLLALDASQASDGLRARPILAGEPE
jgi:RND family efflux transporter MFP subunit